MNSDQLKGRWIQIKGEVLKQWGKLTEDDLDVIGGEREKLIGMIMTRQGINRTEAEKQVDEFSNYIQ